MRYERFTTVTDEDDLRDAVVLYENFKLVAIVSRDRPFNDFVLVFEKEVE